MTDDPTPSRPTPEELAAYLAGAAPRQAEDAPSEEPSAEADAPAAQTAPAEPDSSADPADPATPSDPADPAEPAQPADPAAPAATRFAFEPADFATHTPDPVGPIGGGPFLAPTTPMGPDTARPGAYAASGGYLGDEGIEPDPTHPAFAPPQDFVTQPPRKRLRRSREDSMIGGVAGGLARYAGIDPTIARLGFVAAALFAGFGLPLYVLAWIFVPLEERAGDDGRMPGDRNPFRSPTSPADWAYRVFLVLAAIVLLPMLFGGSVLAAASGSGVAVAIVITGIGAALVLSALRGGARWLIPAALVLAVPLAVVSAVDLNLDGGVGERRYQPQRLAEVKDNYRLGVGSLSLDLRDVEFTADKRIDIDMGMGEVKIAVPEDVCVVTRSEVSVGETVTFGEHQGGLEVSDERTPAAKPDRHTLTLVTDLGVGSIRIENNDRNFPFDPPRGDGPALPPAPFSVDTTQRQEACA